MLRFRFYAAAVLLLGTSVLACAQAPEPEKQAAKTPGIQDNSFLVEEAYNQEFGVVQHISSFTRLWNSKDWVYSFTQEWPVPGDARHQLSYTLLMQESGAFPGSGPGIGDVTLNYRYQLVGNGSARLAFAPRLSVILPAGDTRVGRGSGGVGVQTMLPFSFVVSQKLVTHWNFGATVIPIAKNPQQQQARSVGYNLGQSFVYLAKPRFNVMLETVFTSSQAVIGENRTEWSRLLLINPGVRWSYNFKNGLQIVPGVSAPIGAGPSAGEKGIFLYLSFEHPFRKLPDK